jgi:hypothetical protein
MLTRFGEARYAAVTLRMTEVICVLGRPLHGALD